MGKYPFAFVAMTTILTQLLVTAVPSRGVANPSSTPAGESRAGPTWTRLSVELPTSTKTFPQGEGSSIANSQCLICHSAGMVLLQPQRTQAQWTETINKMRTSYGAPLPAEQVDALAAYLARVIGHDRGTQ
jgi:mono/diheme cytochrome c family protein